MQWKKIDQQGQNEEKQMIIDRNMAYGNTGADETKKVYFN